MEGDTDLNRGGWDVGPATYQSGSRPDLVRPVEPVKVQAKAPVLGKYRAPIVTTVASLDIAEMYRNSVSPHHPDAFESQDRLLIMAGDFFERLNIPVNLQLPVLSIGNGVLVMNGLQISDEMRAAFLALGTKVTIMRMPGRTLEEIFVDLEFFEKIVLGDLGMVRKGTHDDATEVIEA